jgi:hypothetical protein
MNEHSDVLRASQRRARAILVQQRIRLDDLKETQSEYTNRLAIHSPSYIVQLDPIPQREELMRKARQRVQSHTPVLFLGYNLLASETLMDNSKRTDMQLLDRGLARALEERPIAQARNGEDSEQIRRSIHKREARPRELCEHGYPPVDCRSGDTLVAECTTAAIECTVGVSNAQGR